MLFALVLRNTYISSYEILVENFPFPSLLLEKISSGATDAVKGAQNAGKYLRMHACKNILLEIPSFKSVNFQKNTSVLHRYQRKTENSAFTLQGMLQRKSRNISVVVVTNFWWMIQSPDEVQTFGT